ncbi:hypothetical protein [Gimibacter soli]|uniref:Uncharacterized protein n=1 Tax=Gimibacter soli TaxID=3024400 RepID=A0AAE9XQQ0_9PROT|nr:hypothetical protein [Gimibacter soli]WCL54544.1 hypothetical protein PH603_02075 [Gimibacter soli]
MGAARFGSTFYARMGIAMLLFILAGFGPYVMHRFENGVQASPVLVLHGVVFFIWICVFILQAHLVGAGNRALHMRLGAVSPVLAGLMIATSILLTVETFHTYNNNIPMLSREHFIILPLMDGILFTAYYTLAFVNRRRAEAHKHFMLLAAVMIMDPAFGRLGGTLGNPMIGIVLHFGLLVALVIHDRRKLGRVHMITKVALLVLTLRYAAFFLVGPSEGWAGFTAWLFG